MGTENGFHVQLSLLVWYWSFWSFQEKNALSHWHVVNWVHYSKNLTGPKIAHHFSVANKFCSFDHHRTANIVAAVKQFQRSAEEYEDLKWVPCSVVSLLGFRVVAWVVSMARKFLITLFQEFKNTQDISPSIFPFLKYTSNPISTDVVHNWQQKYGKKGFTWVTFYDSLLKHKLSHSIWVLISWHQAIMLSVST